MSPARQRDFSLENPTAISSSEVREELQRILTSDLFAKSPRLGNFLRFIVDSTLKGEGQQIKEYLIGVEVFGRSSSYDPRTDPVVRVEAGRLRSKLADYYRAAGQTAPLLIELPKGRYVPVFRLSSSFDQTASPKTPGLTLVAGPSSWRGRSSRRLFLCLGLLGIVALVALRIVLAVRVRGGGRPIPQATSIAVLPFENLSSSSENQYLGDGVAEELTTGLAQLSGFRVVAATSAFQFRGKGVDVRQIGHQLDASALVEGTVNSLQSGLRINAQLVSTRDGYHLWSKIYDIDAGGIFDAEDDIVRQTARVLHVPIENGHNLRPANRKTGNAEAHDLYLQGRYYWSKRDLPDMERAIQLFQGAIRKDSKFALAYEGLADTYVVLGGNGQKPLAEVVPPAKAALSRAIELDPSLAEAHATLALLNSEASGQRRGLEPELRRAVELSPGYASAHHWLGVILTGQARFAEADAELRNAQLLDPLSPIISEGVAENDYCWRRYDDAIAEVKLIQKTNSSVGDEVLGRAYIQKRMYTDAVRVFNTLRQRENSPQILAELAITEAAAGHSDDARRWLAQAMAPHQPYLSPYWIAVAYVELDDKETAFQWLKRAYLQKDPNLGSLLAEPLFDPIRSDSRYVEMLKKADLIR